jgi:hypothetical protein
MKSYDVFVNVQYKYTVVAESQEEAEKHGWLYEDHPESSQVNRIIVEEIKNDDEETAE